MPSDPKEQLKLFHALSQIEQVDSGRVFVDYLNRHANAAITALLATDDPAQSQKCKGLAVAYSALIRDFREARANYDKVYALLKREEGSR
jgi:hypothetical protein